MSGGEAGSTEVGITEASGTVELRIDERVAWLTLNRPEAANTVNLALARDFRTAVTQIAAADVRAVVIAGNGSAFCAGGDIREMYAADDLPALLEELAGSFHIGLRDLGRLNATIIAAVDGPAAGAGLGLVLNADVAVATTRSTFLTAYDSVELTPDSGVSSLLPRAVGLGRARAMSTLGARLSAEMARDWGLVHEVVGEAEFDEHVAHLARQVAARPQSHTAATRELLRGDGYDAALDAEVRRIAEVARTGTARDRIAAFFEK